MSNRWYGSLQNRLMECAKNPEPEVGMGATELMWSDRHPYEVIEVQDSRHVTVRELSHKLVKGSIYGDAEYEYSSNPDGKVTKLFKTKEGRWVERIGRSYGSRFALGYAEYYYDPSF